MSGRRNGCGRLAALAALIVWLAPALAGAQDSRRTAPAVDRDVRTFQVAARPALDVTATSGAVRIAAGARDVIRVEAVARGARSRRSGRTGDAIGVDYTHDGSRVSVDVRRRGGRDGAVDLEVQVPADTSVFVRTRSGAVAVRGTRGELRVESVSGGIDLADVQRVTEARNVSGAIALRDAAGADQVKLTSVTGEVTAERVRARGLEAAAVSAALRLVDVLADRIAAKSTSGDVLFSGPLARGSHADLSTHSGTLTVRLPAGIGVTLSAETYSGHVASDVPVTLQGGRAGGPRRAIRGTIGDGAAELLLRTFSGDIVIGRR